MGMIIILEPDKSPLMSLIDSIENKYLRRHWKKMAKKKKMKFQRVEDDLQPRWSRRTKMGKSKILHVTEEHEWVNDELFPVSFGQYLVIGHHIDEDGTHHLTLMDMVQNLIIHLVGEEDEGIQRNHPRL